jgi:H+-transporting ATPase
MVSGDVRRRVERLWTTMPNKALMLSLATNAFTGTALTFVGLPGLIPLPPEQLLAILGYAIVCCLVANDTVKVAMIRWCVPSAI